MQKLRVTHLATSLSGGAGIAARRVVQAQVNSGIKAHLFAATYSGTQLENHESLIRRNFMERFRSKSLTYFQKKMIQNSDLLVTPYSLTVTKDWKAQIGNPDIIHIHAFYNLLKLDMLTQLSNIAPLVITMHDQRFFTGGCHYSGNCDGYKSVCPSCPQVQKIFKQVPRNQLNVLKNVFNSLDEAVVISPSQWLANLARESVVLSKNRIEVINNPVPDIFSLNSGDNSKKDGRLVVGFISENLHNPYKGIEVLVDALRRLPLDFEIEVKFMGNGSIPVFSENVGASQFHLNKPAEIAREIRSCDAIIVPSFQDNSPSVISESIMCGVPVIGSRVGGITEIVDEFNLPSFEKGNSEQLKKIILNLKHDEQIQMDIQGIREKFSYATSASRHLELYQSILS